MVEQSAKCEKCSDTTESPTEVVREFADVKDAAVLLELQFTNMSAIQQKLVRAVLDELVGLRARVAAKKCPQCAQIKELLNTTTPVDRENMRRVIHVINNALGEVKSALEGLDSASS